MAFLVTRRIFHLNRHSLLSGFRKKGFISKQDLIRLEYCSDATENTSLKCDYENGLPVVYVPLPSRQEVCKFMMKPISDTVGGLVEAIRKEDGGIDRVAIYTTENIRVSQSTRIEALMQQNFVLNINQSFFTVQPPPLERASSEDLNKVSSVKTLIYQLYSTMNLEDYQLEREREILGRIESLKKELQPLEQVKQELESTALNRANYAVWGSLGLMGLQFGVLARLTWWEYSWDIVEPITYFVTYGTAICCYAYYVLTRQELTFPTAHDRQFLVTFYKFAKKKQLDVAKYNRIKDAIAEAEYDLERLRDPLQLNLPIRQLLSQAQIDHLDKNKIE